MSLKAHYNFFLMHYDAVSCDVPHADWWALMSQLVTLLRTEQSILTEGCNCKTRGRAKRVEKL